MSVYCVLVIRAWTYAYGRDRDYYIHVGGFYTGNRPPVSHRFPPYVFQFLEG
jgi:hypothetical protein